MALNPDPASEKTDTSDVNGGAEGTAYRVSSDPIVSLRPPVIDELGLPRSYGAETLCLMARDPHSLFAYWDIDWPNAFGEENPRPRKVHLRVLNADGSEQTSLEVEPLAGSCYVSVQDADTSYQGEIGFVDSAGNWKAVSRSETVLAPPEIQNGKETADFSTVPFHLSFQRMIDALRANRAEEDQSLTSMLSELRQAASSSAERELLSAEQREVVTAIEEVAGKEPLSDARQAVGKDLWATNAESILGFGNSSLSGGFGGSSRS